jgi:RNA polymerase sigma-70 factor (ECF subfamily)
VTSAESQDNRPSDPVENGNREHDVGGVAGGIGQLCYEELVRDCSVPVYHYVLGMVGDRATAEDLTQEVFLRALERLHQLRDPERARGWLFTIAANTVRHHRRRQRILKWLPLPSADGSSHRGSTPQPNQHHDEIARGIEDVLGVLGPADRQVLLLIGYLGFTAGEAAEVLGVSTAAAHKRWQRACRRFRQAHEERQGAGGAGRSGDTDADCR